MQSSALQPGSILAAQLQQARPAARPDQAAFANAPSAFGALLTPGAKAPAKPDFAPLDFAPAPAQASATQASAVAAPAPQAYARMGSVLDLKV